ncbi:MFS transporter [Alicyclobacillus macrosporangiidus]|uniref:MFS transporter n=1 Tax=Alicyclobacillus macrosporangiidus TaxID=392015 RepID=UPI00068EDCF1|nr:MFS transporter [Alicyclobacillus macrosporangiidus]
MLFTKYKLGTVQRLPVSIAVMALVVLALSYVVNAMDRQVFSVLVPTIDKTFGFSLPQGGLLSTIFTLGIGVAGIPTGYLLDRLTRKSVMLIGIVVYSLFTILTAMSTGFGDMLFYRAGSGIGEAMQNAALFSAVGAYFYKHRAMALGTLNFAYGVGGFFGPLFGGKMLVAYGWKTPFYVYGIIGLIFAIAILFAISTNFTEHEEIQEVHSGNVDHIPEKVWNRNIVIGVITAVVVGLSMYGFLGLYPTFLVKQLGYTTTQASFSLSMFGLGALMGIPAGYLGDIFRQKWVIIISLVCGMIVGYSLFDVVTQPGLQALFSFLEGMFGSGFLFVNTYSLMQRCVRPEQVGRASGIFVTSLYLPSSLAGYLFAALVGTVGWGEAGLIQLTLIPIIGIIAMACLNERQVLVPSTVDRVKAPGLTHM